ncbi:MAG: right-handed parallel beta-helix repeat-containing protein, partial [Candidatus Woesearchaeota archaeon]
MHTLRIKLKQKLKQLEKERDRVANFIEDIQLQQEIGNLSHQTAKKLIKDRIGDKRVEDFFRDLNYKIRYLQNLIEEEKGNQKLIKKKNKTTIFFWLFLFLVIISMFLFIPVQKLLIGFVTFDNVEIKEYKILKNFSDTTAIELNITDVSSLTASGIFFGNGYAKIFLESNKTRYLVFNSDNLINNNENNYTDKNNYPDNFITGFVIYEQDLFNQTETDNLSGLVFDDISNFDNVSDFNLTSSDNMLLNQVFSENNSIKNNDTINIILIDNNELDNNVTVDNINSIDNNIIDNSVNNYTDNKINNETNNEINNSNDDELNNANIFNGELQNISSAGIVFTDECVETCKLEIPTIKLIIEIQNATIFLEKISYTKKTSIRKINAAPVQIRNISDINTKINETVSINLEDYFSDLDNDTLKFETKEHNNIVIIFYNNVVSYTPKEEGVFSTYIYATDGENLIKSNEFNIIVSGVPTAENKILIQDNNITINNNITIQNPIILTSIHAKNPSFILRNSDFVKEKQIKDSEQKDIINYEIALDNNRSIFNITKWNKEVIFSIKDDIEVKELKEFIDGVSLLNDKYETRIYELENGLEYELIFNQKPETNEITFDIDSKDLVFFYQLPLNEKYNNDSCNATDCGGSHRPENVVGSYAVYHSSKKNDNYKTGKAFHIYRPKIIDANNDSVWGLLNIDTDNNKLTISIPQDFLDKAVYPVVVDPTFGYENIGGSSIVYEPDTVVGSLFTSNNEMGVIDSLYGYLEDKAGSVNVKSIIYLSADRTIISDGISDESFVSGRKWFNFSYSINPNINPNTDYVLSIIGNDFFYIYFDDGNENQGYVDDSNNYDNPDNFVNLVNNKNVYSIYATYTVIANSPPNTPVVLINSSNSTNTSDQDINCFAVISDDNENDLLNVSVNWSRNGVWNMTVDYNNSYPNGYSFNAVLGADKLTNGGNWSCAIQLFDGTNYSAWGYSNNLSVVVASNYYNNCYPNASQNLIINQTTTCTNTNIAVLSLNVSPNTRLTLNNVSLIVGKTNIFGNITIKNSPNTIWQNDNLSIFGTYLLENSTLRINGTTDGSIGITLNGSGTMIINNSANITIGSDNNFNYFFRALNSSKINITNSVIEYAGWSELLGQRGLEVNTSNAFIVNNNFVSNYYGLSVYGSNANISNNFFSGTSAVGIFVNGSNNSTIYNNNISFNTITNIDIFGVRVDSGTNNVFNNNYVYNLKGA